MLQTTMAHKWEPWTGILSRLELDDATAPALLNSGLKKVDAFYAVQDSAEAARLGGLQ